VLRDGDLVSADASGIWVFLFACSAPDVPQTLSHMFSLALEQLFSAQVIDSTESGIAAVSAETARTGAGPSRLRRRADHGSRVDRSATAGHTRAAANDRSCPENGACRGSGTPRRATCARAPHCTPWRGGKLAGDPMSWIDWVLSVSLGIVCGALAWHFGLSAALRRSPRYLQPYRAPHSAARKED